MLLRNKKTGEIRELPDGFFCGDNLKKICEEWEDYEEPKEYWYIRYDGCITITCAGVEDDMKQIGNYFSSREEAEKAVEKLKAWKRLKDKGFRFCGHDISDGVYRAKYDFTTGINPILDQNICKDLDLLFIGKGGEE